MKKKIGVSLSEINFQNYLNWFSKEDLQDDIELIELSFRENNREDIDKCDGFILTGGVDVDPNFYNGALDYPNKPEKFETSRDHFESLIYKYSQLNKKPLLAICRGQQLVNVLEGGKLIQDLDEYGNVIHKREDDVDKLHAIHVEKDTLLSSIALSEVGQVNSAHHQAIDPDFIGDNLIANAYSDDERKIIEGVEFKDKLNKAFMLCVQWHPERMGDQDSPFSNGIKNLFLKAVRNTI